MFGKEEEKQPRAVCAASVKRISRGRGPGLLSGLSAFFLEQGVPSAWLLEAHSLGIQ